MAFFRLIRPLLWPLFQLSALASSPLLKRPIRRVRAVRALGSLSLPIAALWVSGLATRIFAPDVHRSLRVWRHVLPIFAGYMWTKWSTDLSAHLFKWDTAWVDKRWAGRHESGGKDVFGMINKVQGYYVKFGQALATHREFVPLQWCVRLAHLWDDTRPRPWRSVRASIRRDLQATQLANAPGLQVRGQHSHKQSKQVPVEEQAPAAETSVEVAAPGTVAVPPAAEREGAGWAMSAPSTPPDLQVAASPGSMSRMAGFFTRMLSSSSLWAAQVGASGDEPSVEQPSQAASVASPSSTPVAIRRSSQDAEHAMAAARRLFTGATLSGVVEGQGTQHQRQGLRQQKQGKGAQGNKKDQELQLWFDSIDQAPLATASIAQVHSARLSGTVMQLLGPAWQHGPEVVVKVQHADVQRLMGADLRNMGRIARFLKTYLPFDPIPAVQEMQTCIPKEFDFAREARLMNAIRSRLQRVTGQVVVPEAVMPLCGPGIIVMQQMQGIPFTALMSRSAAGDLNAREAAKGCLGHLLDAYGYMILVDGLFHADPHPGNMLLQPDGRVALLDFGQCKALPRQHRLLLCLLYYAMASGDTKSALKAAAPFGLMFTSNNKAPHADSTHTNSSTDPAGSKVGSATTSPRGMQATSNGSSKSVSTSTSTSSLSPRPGQVAAIDDQMLQDAADLLTSPRTGLLGRLLSLGRSVAAVQEPQLPPGLDLQAASKMLTILFDTKWIPECAYQFGSGAIVQGAEMESFPAPLFLVCRALFILRGIAHTLGLDVSAVSLWKKYALMGLREKREAAEARAAENTVLDHGLNMEGL